METNNPQEKDGLNESLIERDAKSKCRSKICFILGLFFLGQLNRLSNVSFGVVDKILASHKLLLPSSLVIVGNALFFLFYFSKCGQIPSTVSSRLPRCIFVFCAFLDTSGFVTTLFSYKFTTVTNATLMQISGIFVAALLSQKLFKLKYLLIHYLGMIASAFGLVIALLPQIVTQKSEFSSSMLLGDLLAIVGAACFATENVLQQKVLGYEVSTYAYLQRIALPSIFFCLIFFFATQEYSVLTEYHGDWIYLLYQLPLLALGSFYAFSTILFVKLYGATAFNIISLSGVFYSMLFDRFLFQFTFYYEVVIGYILIIIGVLLFHMKEPGNKHQPTNLT